MQVGGSYPDRRDRTVVARRGGVRERPGRSAALLAPVGNAKGNLFDATTYLEDRTVAGRHAGSTLVGGEVADLLLRNW